MKTRILSWNVNGIRAIYKKGFLDWFRDDNPDILCLQETKAHREQLPVELQNVDGYHTFYASAERKGYSGVALFSREEPWKIREGLGIPRFDAEGRTLVADYGDFILYNIYFPNGKASPERLQYKMDFYNAFLEQAVELKERGRQVIVCGDVNTAHTEIDLSRPRENAGVSGFLPQERAWIDQFLDQGFIDTFRLFETGPDHYSWWDYKTRARERNVGWRIDYFYTGEGLKDRIEAAFILSDVMGSDHCPIGIELKRDK